MSRYSSAIVCCTSTCCTNATKNNSKEKSGYSLTNIPQLVKCLEREREREPATHHDCVWSFIRGIRICCWHLFRLPCQHSIVVRALMSLDWIVVKWVQNEAKCRKATRLINWVRISVEWEVQSRPECDWRCCYMRWTVLMSIKWCSIALNVGTVSKYSAGMTLLRCHYLYFGNSKASQLSTCWVTSK